MFLCLAFRQRRCSEWVQLQTLFRSVVRRGVGVMLPSSIPHFTSSERERERGKRDAERETEGVEEAEVILGPGDMSACSLLPALPDGRSRS